MDCFICNFKAADATTLLLHYSIHHDLQKHSVYKCSYRQCYRSFQNLYTFKKHIKNHFGDENVIPVNPIEETPYAKSTVSTNILSRSSPTPNFENVNCMSMPSSNINSDSDIHLGSANFNLAESALLFATRLYANAHLSRNIATTIINDVKTQLTDVLCNAITKKFAIIQSEEIRLELTNFVTDCKKLFDSINTEYKFNQVIKEKLAIVGPEKFTIEEEMTAIIKQRCSDFITNVINRSYDSNGNNL